MRNLLNTDYYNHPSGVLVTRKKDITAKELDKLKDAKELRDSVVIVAIIFAIIAAIGIFSKVGTVGI